MKHYYPKPSEAVNDGTELRFKSGETHFSIDLGCELPADYAQQLINALNHAAKLRNNPINRGHK